MKNHIKNIVNDLLNKFNVDLVVVYYYERLDTYYIHIADEIFKYTNEFQEYEKSKIIEFIDKFNYTPLYFTWKDSNIKPIGEILDDISTTTISLQEED